MANMVLKIGSSRDLEILLSHLRPGEKVTVTVSLADAATSTTAGLPLHHLKVANIGPHKRPQTLNEERALALPLSQLRPDVDVTVILSLADANVVAAAPPLLLSKGAAVGSKNTPPSLSEEHVMTLLEATVIAIAPPAVPARWSIGSVTQRVIPNLLSHVFSW